MFLEASKTLEVGKLSSAWQSFGRLISIGLLSKSALIHAEFGTPQRVQEHAAGESTRCQLSHRSLSFQGS